MKKERQISIMLMLLMMAVAVVFGSAGIVFADELAATQATTYTLTITKAPNAGGSVAVSTGSLSGSNPFTATYTSGTQVIITAKPATGYTFAGWSGDGSCSGTSLTCTVTMSANRSVTASFSPTLTVTESGTVPSGTAITVSTGALSWSGTTGTATYVLGTSVTLTAVTATGYYVNWGGACSGHSSTCTVTMSAATNVTVTFSAGYVLTVTKTGAGSVSVSSGTLSLSSSGDTYTAGYPAGTSVTITAAAGQVSNNFYWVSNVGGDCQQDCYADTTTCKVTMSWNRFVTVAFVQSSDRILAVTKYGTGSGNVTLSSGSLTWHGNNLGTLEYFSPPASSITLTATADSGSTFSGWSGDCSGTSSTCTVGNLSSLNGYGKTVTAIFSSNTANTLTITTSGGGTVTDSTGVLKSVGNNTSVASYPSGTSVTLTATPSSGYAFADWSGDSCSGTSSTCTLTMSAAKNVKATFSTAYTLTVTKPGTGSGTVTGSTGTLSWSGNTGSATYASGTSVTLTATPNDSSYFAGWTGCDSSAPLTCVGCYSSGASTCTVSMSAAKNVTAAFSSGFAIIATKIGSGTGTVTVSPGTLTWIGNTGTMAISDLAYVTLTATADSGSTFAGWGGDCGGVGTGKCTIDTFISINAIAMFSLPCTSTTTASVNNSYTGSWSSSSCYSVQRSGSYSTYYTLTLSSATNLQIKLTSTSADAYLILHSGSGTSGTVLAEDDDSGGGTVGTDALISQTGLAAGTYTIETTTADTGQTGMYTLTVTSW
ncbi:MAG: hypothetical protein L7F77_12650 [Candidatus Magnetominusculus sp. LBB02]|nr:hypothetical protein [Candidatus Magnetominusculus sp. LBB02]